MTKFRVGTSDHQFSNRSMQHFEHWKLKSLVSLEREESALSYRLASKKISRQNKIWMVLGEYLLRSRSIKLWEVFLWSTEKHWKVKKVAHFYPKLPLDNVFHLYTGYQNNTRKEASLPSELKTVMKSIPYNEFIKGKIFMMIKNGLISELKTSTWSKLRFWIRKSHQKSSQSWILQVHGETMCKQLDNCFNPIWLLLEFSTQNHESDWRNGSIWV